MKKSNALKRNRKRKDSARKIIITIGDSRTKKKRASILISFAFPG
jgi:hypothetical protein